MRRYVTVRNSLDQRRCFGCAQFNGVREIKVSNLIMYLCPGCAEALEIQLQETKGDPR